MKQWKIANCLLKYILLFFFATYVNGLKTNRTNHKCPGTCRCEDAFVVYVSCAWKGYTKIPEDLPANIEHLSFYGNGLSVVKSSYFRNLTRLRVLNLERNAIDTIEEDAFSNLRSLTSLTLAGNKLRSLPAGVFRNLLSLTELHLDFNQLRQLPKGLFASLKNLQKLFLNGNRLERINSGTFAGAGNLRRLDLSKNRIHVIENYAFHNLRKLIWLRLNNNNVTTIAENAFNGLTSLDKLHLDHNSLSTLPDLLIRSKFRLNLMTIHGNPFFCNCNLKWLRRAMAANRVVIPSLSDVRCVEPSFVRNVPLLQVKLNEMNCERQTWSTWSNWSICNTHCGGGLRYRERKCQGSDNPEPRFDCPGNKFQTESCNTHPCPLFQLTDWSPWGACSKTCGYGQSLRTRSCIDFFTGIESELCAETRNETRSCHLEPCKIDGAWSLWSPWSPCSRTCGMAVKRRRRSCTNPLPQHGGEQCDGGFSESQNRICLGKPCVTRSTWTNWSEFTRCSVTCGNGSRTRRRFCVSNHGMSGVGCQGNATDHKPCQLNPCPVDGGWSHWSAWSRCHPFKCKTMRFRNCTQPPPTHGGEYCGGRSFEYGDCDIQDCFVYSQWDTWGPWSSCTKSCNGGYRTRERKCNWSDDNALQLSSDDDSLKLSRSRHRRQLRITCGSHKTEIEGCNNQTCSTGTVWGSWTRWTSCQGGCNGRQLRRRTCILPSIKDGLQYCEGHRKEERKCQSRDCQNQGKEIVLGKHPETPCSIRGNPVNGHESIKKNGDQVIASYSCNYLYRLRGTKKATCNPRDSWSHPVQPRCVPICGKRSVPGFGRARILGGNDVFPGSWPWQVVIESFLQNKEWKVRCGASLINDEWVVTAGHCLFDKQPTVHPLKPSEFKLFFGVHNVNRRYSDKNVQQISIKRVFIHPEFDKDTLDNDIGLMQLERKVVFTKTIRPVCLPNRPYQKLIPSPGRRGYVVGWGRTRNGTASAILQELSLPVVTKEDCYDVYKGQYTVTDNMFCAGRKKSLFDTCKGDSGGGYLFWDSRRRKWTLQGVISWGGNTCGQAGMFSVYTKVSKYTRWIKRITRKYHSAIYS